MEVNKNITTRNRTVMNNRNIKYIVIHYVGAVSTAYANTQYFKTTYRGASAHYFVDDNSIWQCVEDKDSAWHCGGGLQGKDGHEYYQKCLNSNSIGIEMCCYMNNGVLDVSQETINNTVELVKSKMNEYGISTDNVIMHYNVTGKNCPAPFVSNMSRWNDFKLALGGQYVPPPVEDNTNKVKAWQQLMNNVYGCNLAVDGSYGPLSKAQANKHYLHYKLPTIKNEHVRWLQAQLGINQDGSFGPATKNAVKSYQKSQGLTQDGQVGAGTTQKLLDL